MTLQRSDLMLAEEMGCLFLKMNSLYPVTSSPSFFFLVSFQKIDFLGLKKKKIWPLIAGYGLSVGRELQGETFLAEIVSFEEFLGA